MQDIVTECLTTPWPPVAGKPLNYFATPRAEVGDGRLRLWYEADGAPVTSVAEVPLVL